MVLENNLSVAVTGASGFIGRHVLNELIARGFNVIALTRDPSKMLGFRNQCNVFQLDIGKLQNSVFQQIGKPDLLIHLAWEGLPNYKSLHHFESELPVHYKFLKSLVQDGLENLVVAGTCFEYGMINGPLSEEMPTNPENPYGYAKDALRRQLMFLKKKLRFNLTWARLFYIFGQGQPATSLYSQVIQLIEQNQKIFNMSGGEQLRDYLPVDKVAKLMVDLSLLRQDIGAVNVCSGIPVSIRKIVEAWLVGMGTDLKLNLGYYPYPDYEPMAFWGDRSRLDYVLGRRDVF